jgi:hypothetical protein
MFSDISENSLRHGVLEQLTEARRQLKEQEKRLAQLNYEWNIAKRLRSHASNEEEREKWRVQSDAYLGLVMQQESKIETIKESIDHHRSKLAELDTRTTGEIGQ